LTVALLGLRQVRSELRELKAALVTASRNAGRPPGPPPLAAPKEAVSINSARTKGNAAANVALIEFSDFQCPFCARFSQETRPELERLYVETGKVIWAFRHLPLDAIHPEASTAAVAAECAGEQGKFWQMHELLFTNPRSLSATAIAGYASRVGLAESEFERCLSGDMKSKVASDQAEAQRLQIHATPAFLMGLVGADGRVVVSDVLSGAQPASEFKRTLDRLLLRAQ